jgi:hypothetical protein
MGTDITGQHHQQPSPSNLIRTIPSRMAYKRDSGVELDDDGWPYAEFVPQCKTTWTDQDGPLGLWDVRTLQSPGPFTWQLERDLYWYTAWLQTANREEKCTAEANLSPQSPKLTSNNVLNDSWTLKSMGEESRHVTFGSTSRSCTEINHPLCPYRELNAFQNHAKPVPDNQSHNEPYPLYPVYFHEPSRQYSLSEEQVFATFPLAGCECLFEIKSNKDGGSIGDKWISWGKRWKPRLGADREKTLVKACSYIYNTEMTRPDRFFSWEEKPVEVESSKPEPLIQVEQ